MKLNEQQLEQIKVYIQSRGFEQLEVETEIVDHVASAVEEQMTIDPEMSIETAIYNVHWSFGLFGFNRIEDAVSQGLRARLWHLYKTSLWKQWSTKNILFNSALTALIFLLFTVIRQVIGSSQSILYLLAVIILVSFFPIIYHFRVFRSWKKRSMITGKFLLPYAGAGFWVAWLIQFAQPWDNTILMEAILTFSALWLSTHLLAGLNMVSEMYKWTHERWLKFQP